MSDSTAAFGRKVFFLNPPSVLAEVLPVLADAEFEVYQAKDHRKLGRYLAKDPSCLVFVNIDEGDDESTWRSWLKELKAAPATAELAFGALTNMPDEEKREAYLMSLGASCGFITLSAGAAKAAETLLRTLEANEARGRRRYVRVPCPADSASFNCDLDGELQRVAIRDLSSVGMAVSFESSRRVATGLRLKDMQLNLRGSRLSLNGIVMGGHDNEDSGDVRLVMFEPATVDDAKRGKLRTFIRKTLQAGMDSVLDGY